MLELESIKTGENILENSSVLVKVWNVGASGVVLQCTNHYTNPATTILICKLRYINIFSFKTAKCRFFITQTEVNNMAIIAPAEFRFKDGKVGVKGILLSTLSLAMV